MKKCYYACQREMCINNWWLVNRLETNEYLCVRPDDHTGFCRCKRHQKEVEDKRDKRAFAQDPRSRKSPPPAEELLLELTGDVFIVEKKHGKEVSKEKLDGVIVLRVLEIFLKQALENAISLSEREER